MRKTQHGNASFPFLGLLGLLFIGLKLTNFINWSWWWVTAPLWAPAGIFMVLGAFVVVWAVCVKKGV